MGQARDLFQRLVLGDAPHVMDRSFRGRKARYVFQALLAAATLGALLAVEDSLSNAAIITAVASSTYVVFTAPASAGATPRHVIGGHMMAFVIGLAFAVLLRDAMPQRIATDLVRDVIAAVAVGGGMLAMAATDTEHPPAAGTVLGLVLGPRPLESGVLVLASALVLCAVSAWLRRWLIDLD